MTDEEQEREEEYCYQIALPFTDQPATVGRVTDLLMRERAAAYQVGFEGGRCAKYTADVAAARAESEARIRELEAELQRYRDGKDPDFVRVVADFVRVVVLLGNLQAKYDGDVAAARAEGEAAQQRARFVELSELEAKYAADVAAALEKGRASGIDDSRDLRRHAKNMKSS